jgi:hypothetical protein
LITGSELAPQVLAAQADWVVQWVDGDQSEPMSQNFLISLCSPCPPW